jgi:hypothetical protein
MYKPRHPYTLTVASNGKHSSLVLYTGYPNKMKHFNIPAFFIQRTSKIKYSPSPRKHPTLHYMQSIQNEIEHFNIPVLFIKRISKTNKQHFSSSRQIMDIAVYQFRMRFLPQMGNTGVDTNRTVEHAEGH